MATKTKKASGKVEKKKAVKAARSRVRAAKETTIEDAIGPISIRYEPIDPDPVNPMLAAIDRASRP